MDETELIAAARMGNQDAFAQLYRQHARYVRAIGRSILVRKSQRICARILSCWRLLDSIASKEMPVSKLDHTHRHQPVPGAASQRTTGQQRRVAPGSDGSGNG